LIIQTNSNFQENGDAAATDSEEREDEEEEQQRQAVQVGTLDTNI
jgi:hypothetical protein